jgi:L-arabinose isomerase
LLRGITSDKTKAQTQLGEAVDTTKSGLLTQKAGANTQLAALLAQLYESKYDNAPNAMLYSQLAQQASSTPKIRLTSSSPMPSMGKYGGQLEKQNYGF